MHPFKALYVNEPQRSREHSQSEVGMPSFINALFGVNLTRISDDHAIQHDIDQELASDNNRRLILRDLQGFVGGDIENLQRVRNFITTKKRDHLLSQDPYPRLLIGIVFPFCFLAYVSASFCLPFVRPSVVPGN